MSEIQNYDYQKIEDKADYNSEQLKKILIQVREEINALKTRITALGG